MILNLKNDVTVIKKDNMKYIDFLMVFPIGEIDEKDIFNFSIMRSLLSNYSVKYPREDYFMEAKEMASIRDYSFGTKVKGDTYYGVFSFLIPCEGLIDDFNLIDTLDLVHDSLFNSVCKDIKYITDKMYYKEFDMIEEDLKKSLGSFGSYCNNEWVKIIDGTGRYFLSNDDTLNYLYNNTSKERIVELYNKYIINNNYFTVITGNVNDEDYYINSFNKIFKIEDKTFEFKTNYYPSYPVISKGECVQESSFAQSFLRMQFTNYEYTLDDRYLLMMARNFLAYRENNLFFNILRGKYNLVYHCYADSNGFIGSLIFTAYLNEDNILNAKNAILEVMDILKSKDYFEHAKEKMLKADKIALYGALDSKNKETNDFIDDRLKIEKLQENSKKLSEIKYEDFLEFINKFKVNNTLIIKGGKHD